MRMGKSRSSRDPYAPKRNLSSYLLYQNAMRDTFKAENPAMSFGELSKYTSAMYAQLTSDEKTFWQAKAAKDKARYLLELTHYVPSPGYDSNGIAVVQYPLVAGSKKRQRDPRAPKRNLSAYLLYQNAMRDQFRSDNPGMTFGQLSKYTSHMYKSLTLDEKSGWKQFAKRDKVRYDEEMKHYTPPHGFDSSGNLLAEYAVPRKNSRKNPKDPNMPKRTRGSFVLFTCDERPKIFKENPNIKFTALGAVLGERWRALSSEERKKYDDLAEQDKLRFAQELDSYKNSSNEGNQIKFIVKDHQRLTATKESKSFLEIESFSDILHSHIQDNVITEEGLYPNTKDQSFCQRDYHDKSPCTLYLENHHQQQNVFEGDNENAVKKYSRPSAHNHQASAQHISDNQQVTTEPHQPESDDIFVKTEDQDESEQQSLLQMHQVVDDKGLVDVTSINLHQDICNDTNRSSNYSTFFDHT